VFVSENLIQNLLIFSDWMGLNIFGLSWFGVGEFAIDMILLGGM
jgi:hypothetical protein